MIAVHEANGIDVTIDPAFLLPHRKGYYFFAFVEEGGSRHWIDFMPYTISPGHFYFTIPQQVHIFLGSRDQERGDQAVSLLHNEGLTDVEFLLIDVVNEQSVQQAHDELAKRIGHLDVLINNAGIPGDFPQPASNTPDQTFKILAIMAKRLGSSE